MDIVLQDFINQSYYTLSDANKKAFTQLLDESDLDILNWIMGKDEPENDELMSMITLIRGSRNINWIQAK